MSKHTFFLKRGEKTSGPFDLEQLRKYYGASKLQPTDLIALSLVGPWKTISSIEEKLKPTNIELYIKRGGISSGPFSPEEFQQLYIADDLKPTDLIRSGKSKTWNKLADVNLEPYLPLTPNHQAQRNAPQDNGIKKQPISLNRLLTKQNAVLALAAVLIPNAIYATIDGKPIEESAIGLPARTALTTVVVISFSTSCLAAAWIALQLIGSLAAPSKPYNIAGITLFKNSSLTWVGAFVLAICIGIPYAPHGEYKRNTNTTRAQTSHSTRHRSRYRDDIDKILAAKRYVKRLTNYPDTVDFNDWKTSVSGNKVTLTFTAKNGFGVPSTHTVTVNVD